MLKSFLKAWLGDFQEGEVKKFGLLSTIFFMVIGVYWTLRPLKDAIFKGVVGVNYIPMAKMVSLVVVLPLVLLYSKLLDMFPRHRMFYVLCTVYAVLGVIFACIMWTPSIGLANVVTDPYRFWGWAWYVYVESFGSLAVALFWAFVTDVTKTESAVDGFRLVSLGGQLGNVVGPMFLVFAMKYFAHASMSEESIPVEALQHSATVVASAVLATAFAMVGIMALVKYFMAVIPQSQLQGFQDKAHKASEEAEPGFLEGIKILFSSPYLLGIFALITFYEVIVTVFDFNFKVFVDLNYPSTQESAAYLASYGMWTGIVSLICVIIGINRIQKLLGMGLSLILLPLVVGVAAFVFQEYASLIVLFWIMVLAKAFNYALTQPTMKQLYIPTSKEAKYKSMAFIEMYGSRGSKAMASGINNFRKTLTARMGAIDGVAAYMSICAYASIGIIGVWLVLALLMGKTYTKAVKEKRIIC